MALRPPCSPCALSDGASAGRDELAATEVRAEESAASIREDERKFREEVQDGGVQLMRECEGTGRVSVVGEGGVGSNGNMCCRTGISM